MCEGAAKIIPDEVLILPALPYGFEDHHMDFPGTITVRDDHLQDFVVDITKSVAHHGFRKILIVNGHGSNATILETASRRTVIETDAHCGTLNWWSVAQSKLWEMRLRVQSHADEIETSSTVPQRRRHPDGQAVREVKIPVAKYYWRGWIRARALRLCA